MQQILILLCGVWALCCVALCNSCTDTTPTRVSRLRLLAGDSAKTWQMLSDSSYKGLATNPCLLDNDYVFTTSGEFVSVDKGIPCSTTAEDAEVRLPWTLENDSTVLVFNARSRMHIVVLNDTSMVVDELSPADSTTERRTVFRAASTK